MLSSSQLRLVRIGAILSGVSLVAAALLGHRLGLGSSSHLGMTRIMATLFGVLIALAGIAGNRVPRIYRAAALLALNTLVLLIGLELASAVVLRIMEPPAEPAQQDQRTSAYYRTRDWAARYWSEWDAMREEGARYRPYVVSGWSSFDGQQIGIDEEGYRRTPGSVCEDGAYRIFFFGGSTAWGFGSPDWGTIATYIREDIASLLARPVCMRNFGQLGFVSTQSLIQLVRELQAGRVPDLAIFYGGNNDIAGADQTGYAGFPWDNARVAARIEAGEGTLEPRLSDLRWNSNLHNLMWQIIRKPGPAPDEATHHVSDSLAEAVVALYGENHRLASGLGNEYGFKVETFWQPIITADVKPLTPEEQVYRTSEIGSLSERVSSLAAAVLSGNPPVHDLSRVFDRRSELIYLDTHHITPEGNRLVAQAIVGSLQRTGSLPKGPGKGP